MEKIDNTDRLLKSCQIALDELDKVINQSIDLAELDPEKAKVAVQGKSEAITKSQEIIKIMSELNTDDDEQKPSESKTENRKVIGVEGRF